MYLALLCTWFYNANFVPKDGKPLTPEQVIESVEALKVRGSTVAPAQTQEQIASTLRSWAMSYTKPSK